MADQTAGPDDYGRDELPDVPPSRAQLDPTTLDIPAPIHGGAGMARDKAVIAARRAKCVHLRMAGWTYRQIAEAVGYTDPKTARDAVMAALDGSMREGVDQLRELEGLALMAQRRALWPLAMGTPAVPAGVSDGQIIEAAEAVPPDPEAHRVLVRIADRYSKLNGIDMPTKINLTGDIEDQLGELRAAMAEDGAYVVTGLEQTADADLAQPEQAPAVEAELESDDPLEGIDLPPVTVKRQGRMT